jgi:hypothetical protein
MSAQTANLFLLEELEDVGRTSGLAERDLDALHAVADWIKTYVVKPHKDLGRAGPVCPFVPRALEGKTLWLAPEQIADRDVPDVVELINGYQRLFMEAQPTEGDAASNKVIVVVFTDLSADRAKGVFDEALQHLAVPSYVEDGIVFGPFYEGHEGTAIYNSSFRPFRSPVPFVFVRHGIVNDWKFLPGQRRLAQLVGTSLWRVRSPRSCRGTTPLAMARGARLIRERPRFERSYLMPPTAVLREPSPATTPGWCR